MFMATGLCLDSTADPLHKRSVFGAGVWVAKNELTRRLSERSDRESTPSQRLGLSHFLLSQFVDWIVEMCDPTLGINP